MHLALAVVVGVGCAATPLAFGRRGFDHFNLPHRLVVETEAILALGLLAAGTLIYGAEFLRPLRGRLRAVGLIACVFAWTLVSSLTSVSRLLSVQTVIWVAAASVIVLATLLVADRCPGALLLAGLLPVIVNGSLGLLQRTDLYNPLTFEAGLDARQRVTGVVGNPNVLATFLAFGVVAALALALVGSKRLQAVGWLVTGIAVSSILATETLSALGAVAAAVVTLIVLRFRARAIRSILVLAAAAVLIVAFSGPIRHRVFAITQALVSGSFNVALSHRLTGNAVAWEIFRDHPVAGSGPGTFHWLYLPYKMEIDRKYPGMERVTINFGEAHNDHLQTLAVGGAVGYALMLLVLWQVARTSLARPPEHADVYVRWAHLVAMPLVVCFAVVAAVQFPLETAAPSRTLFHFAALAVALGRR